MAWLIVANGLVCWWLVFVVVDVVGLLESVWVVECVLDWAVDWVVVVVGDVFGWVVGALGRVVDGDVFGWVVDGDALGWVVDEGWVVVGDCVAGSDGVVLDWLVGGDTVFVDNDDVAELAEWVESPA